jgi:hypothetical protein
MSKATLLQSLLGEIAPKAAPAAAASLLLPGQDAEAMPAAAFKAGVQHPVAQLRKQVAKNKQNGVSPEKTVTDWIHKNTNYEHIGKAGRNAEGMSGDYYKGQIEDLYKMILEGADKDTIKGLDAWKGARVGRDSSHQMPHVAAAAGAAGLAGAGNASASEAGFPSWEQYEPEPSMWEKAGDAVMGSLGTALEPWVEGGAIAESAIGKHVAGNVGDVMDLAEIPARAAHGVARGGWGLLNGESAGQALEQGVGTYNSTIDENAERLSKYVKGRGAHPDDVSAAYWATLLSDPTNLLGLGIAKGAVKGAIR